ncbi:MAG: hypothetical protein FJ189_13330, partial [Gammaproteobacteria bacterium]|nr:hypothetical protein [Gammaproteobacteria bacterium]
VDILGTQADKTSYTVLSGVNVLAIDQEASPEKNQPAVVRSLTVEVSPEQAERLDQAVHLGPLRFTLRNPYDAQPATAATPPPPKSVPSAARVAPVTRTPTQPTLTIIEWTGKGQGVVDRCDQWPCAGRGASSTGPLGGATVTAPHQELLNSISSVGQAVE